MKFLNLFLLMFNLFIFDFTFSEEINPYFYLDTEMKSACEYFQLDYNEYRTIFPLNEKLSNNFEAITCIKSGSNLLFKLLALMSGISPSGFIGSKFDPFSSNRSHFYINHFYTDETLNYFINSKFKTFTIIRDPRDTIISYCYWIEPRIKLEDIELIHSRLSSFLHNTTKRSSKLKSQFQRQCKLISEKSDVCVVRFENLIGEKGGGTKFAQENEIKKIADFLNMSLSQIQIDYLVTNLHGNSFSFRKGFTGEWKQHFDEELKDLFKREFSEYLFQLGYESDNQW